MGSGGANSVREWLVQSGLRHHTAAFAGVTEVQFMGLMMQDYGKFGVVDMDDKQKMFRLVKRLNTDPMRGTNNGVGDRGLQTPRSRNSLVSGKDSTVDSLEAKLRAQMLDGNAALLSLADDSDDYLLQAGTPQRGYRERSPSLAMSPQASAPVVLPPEEPNLPKIRVVVRKRPLNRKEEDRGEEDSIEAVMAEARLTVHEPRVKVDLTKYVEHHAFAFDDVLDGNVSNDAVYRSTVQPLVATIFRSGKATCFAYGQTGSGKTYTMQPLPLRAAADIFRYLTLRESQGLALWVSCFEIYGGKLYDLLNRRQPLVMREDGKGRVCIVGLKEVHVSQPEAIQELVTHASKARSTGSTGVNDESSRSHSIMQFALKRESESDGHPVGKISFIDLAGSERGADTYDNNRQTRMEGAQINKSLLALKECIRALDASAHHVPFRGSKLTEVLRDSFTGDQARTVMIANVSPASSSCEHTLNTLRYADRVKELRKDKAARFSCAMPQRAASPPPRAMLSPRQAPGTAASPAMRARHASLAHSASPHRHATPPRGGGMPEAMASPRPGQRQVAPPLKVRRGTVGTLEEVKLAAAKRSATAAEDSLACLAGRHDDSQHQAQGRSEGAEAVPAQGPAASKEAALKALSRRMTADESCAQARPKAGEGSKRALGFEAADAPGHVTAAAAPKSAEGAEADLREMLGARDELMNRILEEEDNLIAAHRWQIEETMAIVRQEMTLLGQIDQPGSAIDAYIGGLRDVLERKASNIAQLQGRLESFQAQLRDEEELSNLISAKMHMRSDAAGLLPDPRSPVDGLFNHTSRSIGKS